MDSLRKGEGALFYLFVSIFHIFRLEGGTAIDESIDDDTHAPNIDFIAVPFRF
jgi:hypothetical protein